MYNWAKTWEIPAYLLAVHPVLSQRLAHRPLQNFPTQSVPKVVNEYNCLTHLSRLCYSEFGNWDLMNLREVGDG
ncbi:MAG: hypothetical protein MUO99_01250 [Dehalococcoidales bacterium]|nr:hypothetical protein [Dehalococcoidales bacterium]